MTFEARLAVLTLAAFAAGSLFGTVLVPWLARRVRAHSPRAIAGSLFHVRLLPVALAVIASSLVFAAYVGFEPRAGRPEATGVVLGVLAAVAAVLIGGSAARWVWMQRDTYRLLKQWRLNGRPISFPGLHMPAFAVSSDFPIVCVVGVFRPTLVVAQSVLDACSPEELRAILAHEQGHVDRRDNLRRALMVAAPDLVSWLPISKQVQSEWHAATEEAADDLAGRLGERGRPQLAGALLTVARLAPACHAPQNVPASALYRGEGLERRVRRLLLPSEDDRSRSVAARAAIAAVGLALAAASLNAVHDLIETAVHGLP